MTTNSGAFTVAQDQVVIATNGDVLCTLNYASTSTGKFRGSRVLRIPGDGTAIVDQDGAVVAAAGTFTALATAITNFKTAVTTAISNGAGASKLDL